MTRASFADAIVDKFTQLYYNGGERQMERLYSSEVAAVYSEDREPRLPGAGNWGDRKAPNPSADRLRF